MQMQNVELRSVTVSLARNGCGVTTTDKLLYHIQDEISS
jgi:hypothetical protein